MGRNQASTRHVRHVEKGQMPVSTREPRVEALSQVGHLSGGGGLVSCDPGPKEPSKRPAYSPVLFQAPCSGVLEQPITLPPRFHTPEHICIYTCHVHVQHAHVHVHVPSGPPRKILG